MSFFLRHFFRLVNSVVYVEERNEVAIGGLFTIVQNRSDMVGDWGDDDTDGNQFVFYSLAIYSLDEEYDEGLFYPVFGFYGDNYVTGLFSIFFSYFFVVVVVDLN